MPGAPAIANPVDFTGRPRWLDLWRERPVVGGKRCDWPGDQGHADNGNRCGIRPDDALGG